MRDPAGIERLEAIITSAFTKALSSKLDDATIEMLSGMFYAEVEERLESSITAPQQEDWEEILESVLAGQVDAEPESADLIMLELMYSKALANVPEDDGSGLAEEVAVGTQVLAELEEDSAWHEAQVIEVLDNNAFVVQFELGAKRQKVNRDGICTLSDVTGGGDGGEDKDGECPICERVCLNTNPPRTPSAPAHQRTSENTGSLISLSSLQSLILTRHHLIPRTTHDHFKKHPHPVESDLFVDVYLCRQCHSALHRFKDEMTLAKEYYNLDLILAAEEVQNWSKYARNARIPARWQH